MKKQINPNMVAAILVFSLVVVVAILAPVKIEIVPSEAAAQDAGANTVSTLNAQVVEYTLQTIIGGEPLMRFVGVGGDIDGVINPELIANVGDTVRVTIVNGNPALHDFRIDAFNVNTGEIMGDAESKTVEFVADQTGEFSYYCSIPGHQPSGMEGLIQINVSESVTVQTAPDQSNDNVEDTSDVTVSTVNTAPAAQDAISIIRNPADLPGPIGDRGAETLRVDMTATEVNGVLADGTTFRYMTFDGQVPGPMLRMRVGDTMELHLHNQIDSLLPHSIDLHAVTGPGGGAVFTQTVAGEESIFTFQALQPGLFVYHCATPSIGHHISSGMYGLILVEPVGGLPPVDHEFYIMQGEIYTEQPFGTAGNLDFSQEKLLNETPEYYVFNGAAGALTQDDYALRANVGDSVRIYFGVGGPNKISSFHMIGEIFDRVYNQASLTTEPMTDVQTTLVPPGGATVVEFTLDVPGRYILVDHAISRVERGLAGYLYVEGNENPAIFHEGNAAGE